jgi:arabinofuranosyltransferase
MVLAWTHRWTVDDGFIVFRVVDQVLAGNGPVFNAGERIEAVTSPMWLALLVVLRVLIPDGVGLEEIALWAALLLSGFGLLAASLGSARLAPARAPPARWYVPFGSLVVVALTAFWDYATAGLETGLSLAWLGTSFWALVCFSCPAPSRPRRRWLLVAFLLGLGPLIRPDFGLFSLCFVSALLVVDPEQGWRPRAGLVAAALAVPFSYQIFRTGYYAILVPNTALAKSAGASNWDRGVDYARNLIGSYRLYLALAPVVAVLVVTFVRVRAPAARAAVAAPVVGASLHALYVAAVGGDYLHGRLLLPSVFALTSPVAVIVVERTSTVLAAAALLAWALVCGLVWRPVSGVWVADPRPWAVALSGSKHPVTLEDYEDFPWLDVARTAKRLRRRGEGVLYVPAVGTFPRQYKEGDLGDPERRFRLSRSVDADAAVAFTAIGAVGYAVGPEIFVLDRLGLTAPVGGRLTAGDDLPPGHEKFMTLPWVEARLAEARDRDSDGRRQLAAERARQALECGALARVMRDVTEPLTLDRFVGNLRDSIGNTRLSIPKDAGRAAEKLCA